MTFKKKYLTISEMMTIISQMEQYENACERELIKICLIYDYCVEDDRFDFSDTTLGIMSKAYNTIISEGFADEIYEIKNLNEFEECVRQTFGVTRIVSEILNQINTKIDDAIKNIDTSNLINSIESMVEQ